MHVFKINEQLHVFMETKLRGDGWGRYSSYDAQHRPTRDPSLTPESRMCLGLGQEVTLVNVGE